jgi:glyoxylase-like metal-dependent hydrolase (beta-lactamase superfamily II)
MPDVVAPMTSVGWNEICPGVWRAQDSCNVYALMGPAGAVIVDAGTGAWLDRVSDLPIVPVALVCTHFYRDHCAGAPLAAAAGIPVYVSEYEEPVFTDPTTHHQQRMLDCTFDICYWNHFAPIEATPVAGVLRDYEVVTLGGLELEIVPLPGAAISQIGLRTRLPHVGTVVLCGETVHSPGKIPRMAPLQHFYTDLDGAPMVYGSLRELRRNAIDVLLPSLGEPIVGDVDAALTATQHSVRAALERRRTPEGLNLVPMGEVLDLLDGPDLESVSEHVYRSLIADGKSTFLISSSGKVMAMDYGFSMAALNWYVPGRRHTRRIILHSLDGLERLTGSRGIDVLMPTHLHDDHAGGATVLNRVFGTEVWAGEGFAESIENPHLYNIVEIWPEQAPVHRRLAYDSEFTWEEYTFRVGPDVSGGHTSYQMVFSFEADGLVFAVVGDEYLSERLWLPGPAHSWETDRWDHAFSYHQGTRLKGFRASAEWLLALQPDYILNGHQAAIVASDVVFQRVREWLEYFDAIHRRVMPVSDGDVHFDIDSQGGQLRPYRRLLREPGILSFSATVRNPLPRKARLSVRLVGPGGLSGDVSALDVEAHGEADLNVCMWVDGPWKRQPVALELVADGRPFGQVSEAMVTVGHERW